MWSHRKLEYGELRYGFSISIKEKPKFLQTFCKVKSEGIQKFRCGYNTGNVLVILYTILLAFGVAKNMILPPLFKEVNAFDI